jgi:hypothetical protein
MYVAAVGLNAVSEVNCVTGPRSTGLKVASFVTGASRYAVAGTPITAPIAAPRPTDESVRN